MSKTNQPVTQSWRLREEWPVWLIYGVTLVAFYPLLRWLVGQTGAHDQLLHAVFVLGLAGVIVFLEERRRIVLAWEFSRPAQWLLIGAFALFGATALLKIPALLVVSFCLAVASFLLYVFGEERKRWVMATVAAFGFFVLLSVLLPVFDWPLRELAGKNAGWVLSMLGHATQLSLVEHQGQPALLLLVDNVPFHVAPECNGFGVMTSSLLLSVLLVTYRPLAVIDKALLIVFSVLIAFGFNVLRIVIIVTLAPTVGQDNYFLMHEIVGTITYYGCLVLIWQLIAGFQAHRKA